MSVQLAVKVKKGDNKRCNTCSQADGSPPSIPVMCGLVPLAASQTPSPVHGNKEWNKMSCLHKRVRETECWRMENSLFGVDFQSVGEISPQFLFTIQERVGS